MKTKISFGKKHLIAGISTLVALIAVALYFVTRPSQEDSGIDFSNYIAAHTSGTISTYESIKVVFAGDVSTPDDIGKEAGNSLLRLRPSVKGTLIWYNERTLEFIPEKPLDNNREYSVSVALNQLHEEIPRKFREFVFTLRTIKQAMEVRVDGIAFYDEPDREERRIAGEISTADFVDLDRIKEVAGAVQNGRPLDISWAATFDSRTYNFWIEGVTQAESAGKVELTITGREIGAGINEKIEIEVPAMGEFRVLSHKVMQAPQQYVELLFSEPLDPSQNMRGLISSADINDLSIIVDGNKAMIYPGDQLAGTFSLGISSGIRDIRQNRLGEELTLSVTFEVLKPQVRLTDNGVIMPSSGNLLFPFQAVSLRAVDLTIVRIFEQNVAQFLQTNTLAGQRELRRVGRTILRKTLLLDQDGTVDFNSWNTYHIDLSELIQTEPGAIYLVNVNFRPEYSTYFCNGEISSDPVEIIEEYYNPHDDLTGYSYFYNFDFDYNYDYDWRERDNPCNPSYYRNRSVTGNFLASDLGMIAKSGNDGSLDIIITDLNTAEPMGGVDVKILNFQQTELAGSTTSNQGIASFSLSENKIPFLALAKRGNQRGYLKLDRGSALSLSAFDVSGDAVQQGLKGYMYGERGVWRPGDTLFISFILEDKGETLPANHPVMFELTNPRGTLVHRSIATRSTGGIYTFPVATERDAPTGNYRARVRVGGASFTRIFMVETIMPNRLKIDLRIEGDAIREGKTALARFGSAWLHGAPARNLRVKVDAILSQATTSFEGYDGFSFDDPARSFQTEEVTLFEGTLDAKGLTSFNPGISVKTAAPGMLNASFTARVFEESGAYSIDRFTIPYYPYEYFAGLKMPESNTPYNAYLTDTTHVVELVSLNSEGRPAPGRTLRIEVYKIDWRWWWERRDEDLSNYISSSYHRPLQRARVTTGNNGRANYNLRIDNPEWGRFLIRVTDINGGHAAGTTVYMDWPGWVSRDRPSTPEAASMLVFASDKEKYDVGENIHLTIPSPSRGKIFLTVENGTGVLQNHWIDAQPGETRFTIMANEEMTPNVYIHAMLLQPYGQTANDLPIRMYGIAPIRVEDPNTHLQPVIKMPDELEPEEKVSITVSEKEGRPMAFTLAVVDDGLLDLTRFRTPDPWNRFYAREALGVNTWDLYNLVLGASTARMMRILSIGGDEEVIVQGDKSADRFKPVVRFFGPFETGRGGRERIEFTMPNYVGSVRVMAVAAKDGAYGAAEKTVPVRKPLMVLGTLPRVLGPQEDVVLPVTIFAMEENVKDVKVLIETNDFLDIRGPEKQKILFESTGDQVVRFNLTAADRPGIGRVKIIAESGGEKAAYDIELDVRNANPPMTRVQDTIIDPGSRWKTSYSAFGMKGTNTASIELGTLPPLNLGKRLSFLTGYPHGCLEQIISGAFPRLYLEKLADIDERLKRRTKQDIREVLDKLIRYRTSEGGLSLWPGGTYPDEWASVYAGHFMLEAARMGYSLPPGILEGWIRSTQRAARNWSPSGQPSYNTGDLMQSYRLYVLALANSPELGAMNRLRETGGLSTAARWRLAAAYSVSGNREAAMSLISDASTYIDSYREQAFTFGSRIRDKAMIVETLVMLGKLDEAFPLIYEISEQMASGRWMSTQETSYSLIAYSRFAEAAAIPDVIDANISIHDQPSRRHRTDLSMMQHQFESLQSGEGKIEVENSGEGLLYARLITHGTPVAGKEDTQSNNLQMEVNYHLMNGEPVDPVEIDQGTDFYADIRIINPGIRGDLRQLILSFIVPSGWEIRESGLDEGHEGLTVSPYDYRDIRDDRVYTYFRLSEGRQKLFRIRLNAAYEGHFYMPGISCEAMYDNTVNARVAGSWVEVKLP